VDCTFSYLEVQAMTLQETPPQVRDLVYRLGLQSWFSPLTHGALEGMPAVIHGSKPSSPPLPGHL
jgi:hypothetical protein